MILLLVFVLTTLVGSVWLYKTWSQCKEHDDIVLAKVRGLVKEKDLKDFSELDKVDLLKALRVFIHRNKRVCNVIAISISEIFSKICEDIERGECISDYRWQVVKDYL